MNKTVETIPFKETDLVVLMEDNKAPNGHSIVLLDDYISKQLKNKAVSRGTYNIIHVQLMSIPAV